MSDLNLDYDKQDPNSKLVSVSVIVTVLFLAVVILASYYFFVAFLSVDLNSKQQMAKSTKSQLLNKAATIELNALKWADKGQGRVKIPIDVAIKYVVKEYQ